MSRSRLGLAGAGEWEDLQKLLPDFAGKQVLDLGCGYGWHCAYAAEHGAAHVTGVDLSEKMLEVARQKASFPPGGVSPRPLSRTWTSPRRASTWCSAPWPSTTCRTSPPWRRRSAPGSSPAGTLCSRWSIPSSPPTGNQDWYYDEQGNILHFPVDNYFYEGQRQAVFLGEDVVKYHRTLTTYLDTLLTGGFALRRVVEAKPPERMLDIPGMKDELRRPMMLLVAAVKL